MKESIKCWSLFLFLDYWGHVLDSLSPLCVMWYLNESGHYTMKTNAGGGTLYCICKQRRFHHPTLKFTTKILRWDCHFTPVYGKKRTICHSGLWRYCWETSKRRLFSTCKRWKRTWTCCGGFSEPNRKSTSTVTPGVMDKVLFFRGSIQLNLIQNPIYFNGSLP